MCSTNRVLPHPVGPVSITGMWRWKACSNSCTSLPLAKYVSEVISSSVVGRSCRNQLAVHMGQYARQLLDAPYALRTPWPEHFWKWVDARRPDADVVHGDTGVVGLLDRMCGIGPRVPTLVALVGDQAVTDDDQQAAFGGLREEPAGQVAKR